MNKDSMNKDANKDANKDPNKDANNANKDVNKNDCKIYSKSFMFKAQNLDISKICPYEIDILKIVIENKKLTLELPKELPKDKFNKQWIRGTQLHTRKCVWTSSLPLDSKRITSILNKLTTNNYDNLLEEAKTFNYAAPEVVTILFKKVLAEPLFSGIYARLCNDLIGLHDLTREFSIVEFKKIRHKNLGPFIGELHKFNLIDLNCFVDILLEDINDANLEILCKIIITIGTHDPIFKDIIEHLDSIKNQFTSRYKFMIMDIVDHNTKNLALSIKKS